MTIKQRITHFMLTILILLFGLATPQPGSAQTPHFTIPDALQRFILYRYAADTWQSFAAMTHPDTGLPADHWRIFIASCLRHWRDDGKSDRRSFPTVEGENKPDRSLPQSGSDQRGWHTVISP